MGVVNNKIEIDKLKKGGGGADLEERLSHLEDEYTELVTFSTDEKECGEWYDGSTIYKKVVHGTATNSNTGDFADTGYALENIKELLEINALMLRENNYWNLISVRVDKTTGEIYVSQNITSSTITYDYTLILYYTKND